MNFNISAKPDYKLQSDMTHEMINLYGVLVKFMKVTQQNVDSAVFGDFSHMKSTSDSYNIYALPENSDEWNDIGVNFSDFGMLNTENINLFVSRKSIDSIFPDFDSGKGFSHILSNLIILPNNKIMEISNIQFEVPGVNNVFTNNDTKNVYKLTCVTFNNKVIQEIPKSTVVPASQPNVNNTEYDKLDKYFNELLSDKEEVDADAISIQPDVEKPLIDKSEDNVFGDF